MGSGDLFLDVAGDVTQTGSGTITVDGLGLMVDGDTQLQLANDAEVLAAGTGGTILFNDVDGLTIGTVTVLDGFADEMQLMGITTSDADVKLIAGDELVIEEAIDLVVAADNDPDEGGSLYLDVEGNVTQTGSPGTITSRSGSDGGWELGAEPGQGGNSWRP